MKLFGFTFARRAPTVRLVYGPELLGDDSRRSEVSAALAVPLAQPVLRAVLQLLDTAEDNANRAAANDPVNREKYVGGAEQCRLLIDDLLNRREQGLEELAHRLKASN